jgi:DNA-binding winged helix-turn-helix (wHTH) protein
MFFAFGDFELDVEIGELKRSGERVAVQPKVLATLRYLIEHRDRVVSRRELIDALWGGQHLNNIAVPWSVSHARKALGQRRNTRGPIETIRGRGYRFLGDVRAAAREANGRPPESQPNGDASNRAQSADPFIGRADVMEQLMTALEGARGGEGGLWLLSGDAGIGKTRCATEFLAVTRRAGVTVWMARCLGARSPAFWPWIQLLREIGADTTVGDAERREARELVRRLAPIDRDGIDASRRPTLSPSDASRFWLLQRVARSVRKLAERSARVIVIDDLHAADDGSLQVLTLIST